MQVSIAYSGNWKRWPYDNANHLYDADAADNEVNDMGSKLFKEFIFWTINEIINYCNNTMAVQIFSGRIGRKSKLQGYWANIN